MNEIVYKVYYKNRKTSSISINESCEIIVKVPIGTNKNEIEELVKRKSKWIKNKINIVNGRKKLNYDEVMYLGEIYKVRIMAQPYLRREFITLNNRIFFINIISSERTKKVLENWFRKECKKVILESINKYQKYFISVPKEIRIKEQKRRWGSCSYDNRLFFNWKLIMGRKSALEYVVVHEMCHMVHKNHSKEYWNLVEKIMPNYKLEHSWLKENGYLMSY